MKPLIQVATMVMAAALALLVGLGVRPSRRFMEDRN